MLKKQKKRQKSFKNAEFNVKFANKNNVIYF